MRPILVAVKTFERPDLLMNLLRDLDRERPTTLTVVVFDDGSNASYSAAKRFAAARDWPWVRFEENHGKKRAWEMANKIFSELKGRGGADHFYFLLDDDMRLCSRFFERALEAWGHIDDGARIALHLMVDRSRKNGACWTGVTSTKVNDHVALTQWVDGSFMCERTFFEHLKWKIEPIGERRWKSDPARSTGVGQQMSHRLVGQNRRIYQVLRSLVVHVDSDSKYNPGLRPEEPLETADFVDGEGDRQLLAYYDRDLSKPVVEASLATIPSRLETLKQVVDALYDQVDRLRIYLNGYDDVPTFLDAKRIVVRRSQDHGDRGDAGKFHWCEEALGYQLTCDDDLAYPRDYAARMVEAVERHGRRAVVGVHGLTLGPRMLSYYKSRHMLHFRSRLGKDQPVHVLGTGLMAYHADTLRVRREHFEVPNMADIWMALLCQKERVPMVAIERPAAWIKPLPTEGSIHARHQNSDGAQTAAVKRLPKWQLFPV